MKTCTHCKEEVPKNAKKCKHCHGDLRNWFAKHKILTTIGVVFLIGLAINGTSPGSAYDPSKNTHPEPKYSNVSKSGSTVKTEQKPKYILELEASNYYKSYGYVHIEGRVKNLSNKSMENVEAVGEFFDKDGNFVKSSSSLIDYDPILAGQSSPFEVLTSDNPAITNGTITFKELIGGTIKTKYPEDSQ